MEKIRINFTKDSLNKLTSDMSLFEFFKSDNTINKNKYINTLIINYFPIFDKLADSQIEKYTKIVNTHIDSSRIATDIINDLLTNDKIFSFYKSDCLTSFISFKPNKEVLRIVNIIEDKYLKYQSLSSFLRNMIEEYLALPQYEREKIIFLENYEMISESIKDNLKIKVYFKSSDFREVVPYKIATNKEEIHNYLLAVADEKTVVSFRLSRIDYIYKIKEKVCLSSKLKDQLEKVAESGAQFPYNNAVKAVIELTKEGERLYKKKYLNRPSVTSIDDSMYHFECSYNQLLLYFFAFGKEAKVISPYWLKEKMKKEYFEAYNSYTLEP